MQTEARVSGVALDSHGAVSASRHKEEQQRHIGTAAHLAAGAFADVVSKTCTVPLARLTILFQVAGMHLDVAALRKCIIWHEASQIVREEGFGAFWNGNLGTIVHRLPYSVISFYSYERYKKLLGMVPGLDDPNYVTVVRLLGGGLAGVTAASVTCPLDVVRTCLATQGCKGKPCCHCWGALSCSANCKALSTRSCCLSAMASLCRRWIVLCSKKVIERCIYNRWYFQVKQLCEGVVDRGYCCISTWHGSLYCFS